MQVYQCNLSGENKVLMNCMHYIPTLGTEKHPGEHLFKYLSKKLHEEGKKKCEWEEKKSGSSF